MMTNLQMIEWTCTRNDYFNRAYIPKTLTVVTDFREFYVVGQTLTEEEIKQVLTEGNNHD